MKVKMGSAEHIKKEATFSSGQCEEAHRRGGGVPLVLDHVKGREGEAGKENEAVGGGEEAGAERGTSRRVREQASNEKVKIDGQIGGSQHSQHVGCGRREEAHRELHEVSCQDSQEGEGVQVDGQHEVAQVVQRLAPRREPGEQGEEG